MSANSGDLHEAVALRVANELGRRADVLAVMVGGSVARGDHVASSDVDLVIVSTDDAQLATSERSLVDGLLVEWIARTELAWLARFNRARTSWLYAFLDVRIVMDTGPAARLSAAAKSMLSTYHTSAAQRELLATWLWHGQAKLERARANGDPAAKGFHAALFVETLLDGLYAVHNVPLPAGSRLLEHLHRVPLTARERQLLEAVLTGDTERRFGATCDLATDLREQLGPPDHGA